VTPRRKKTEVSTGGRVLIAAFGLIFVLFNMLGNHGLTPTTIILTVVSFVIFCVVLAGTFAQHHEQKLKKERFRQESEERSRQMEEDRRRKREQREEELRREEEERRRKREQREEELRREEQERAEQIEALLQRDTFRDSVDYMSGVEFENFMANVFAKKGYPVQLTPGSGDQGVDLLLNIDERRVAVQLKRYTAPVGNRAVQEAFAGMIHYKAKEAWVITTSTFTKKARELAKSTGIRLIDRNELEDWLSDLREEADNPSRSPDRRRQRRRRC
jgi:restriction endonuclease Mrr